jgi:dUTP pyrophosphatase
MIVRFKRMHPDAIAPAYQTAGASGMDLHSCETRPVHRGDTLIIDTGLGIELPPGFEAQVRPRSGLSKRGIQIQLGTVDFDYRGPIGVCVYNAGLSTFWVQPGDRIAQLVVVPILRVQLAEVTELTSTTRGAAGFGSTGVSK